MNKIKTRHAKRAMHAKRRGKHTTRKGYRKYKKHYTQKNVKRIQGQGKGRLRKQRQTRRKVGGEPRVREFNFVLPYSTDSRFQNIQIQGQGWAYVTKLGSLFSMTNRPEQIIIYQHKDKEEKASGNYFIARCVSSECSEGKKMESKILETEEFDDVNNSKTMPSCKFTTINGDKYEIILIKPLTFDSIQSNKIHEVHKVKVKGPLGMFNDVSVYIKEDSEGSKIMSMTIDGKVKNFSLINPILNKYIKIDDICYASYNFYIIDADGADDADATMEIFVPVSSEEGSIFQIVNPNEVNYLKYSPIFPCD